MSRIPTHLLAYAVSNIIERKMRSLKVPRPKAVAEDLVPLIMDELPAEAFDPRDISEDGLLIFHGEVDEDRCRAMQEAILETHVNTRRDVPITLMLSTIGGDVFAGLALASTMQRVRREGRKVNVHIQGCAMSMGSLMAQAADHRSIEANAWFMVHELNDSPPKQIKTSEIQDLAEVMARLESQTFALYATRSGKPVSYWRKKVNRKDVYFSAEEALAEGLVDEIVHAPPYRRSRQNRKATSSMPAAAHNSSTR